LDVSRVILFAGGGSGGHISPGLAIAERVRERSANSRAIFICSNRAIDREMLENAGEEYVAVPAAPPSLRPTAAVRFITGFMRSRSQARQLLSRQGVGHVVALGGFVSVPVVFAARGLVPITLVNLDAPPGRANRIIAPRCDRVLSAVELPMSPGFAERVVGMPVRRRALAPADARECRTRLGLDSERPVLLVTGASQGATSVNEMMTALATRNAGLFRGWQVLHLAGRGGDDPVRRAYEQAGVGALVLPFLHEIGLAWGAAELVVSRSGANAVAEIAANAVPAIFMPYPHHADMHQRHNAQPLVKAGGAVLLNDCIMPDANARLIEPLLCALLADGSRRTAMRAALQAIAGRDAAKSIAEMLG
jgi:UDP-N-acetylglucosamine--N-acetylmuramyl-(pentapeptide) pyrophosphoryl-undecaprenol N-acetylglucosamine transferase